ncbi:MAG: hypothetical protein Q4D62_01230 [Planctomycetia bacterium]|nr:hypothetical protein [Planctomycetia bacterium]
MNISPHPETIGIGMEGFQFSANGDVCVGNVESVDLSTRSNRKENCGGTYVVMRQICPVCGKESYTAPVFRRNELRIGTTACPDVLLCREGRRDSSQKTENPSAYPNVKLGGGVKMESLFMFVSSLKKGMNDSMEYPTSLFYMKRLTLSRKN